MVLAPQIIRATIDAIGGGFAARISRPRGMKETNMASNETRLPTLYLPHGGGPWPWMRPAFGLTDAEKSALTAYLEGIVASLPRRPRAMVVVSAHWEAPLATVTSSPRPPLLFDYSGFPPETYRIAWPAPGEPQLAARVRALLEAAGFPTAADADRGFDHGTFVPLKLSFPEADVPAIQLSLLEGLDPQRHLALGRALAPLRDEGVLLVGSGMSFHNMRDLLGGATREARTAKSAPFDDWLVRVVAGDAGARDAELARWAEAPGARAAHPREEHLLPLMVIAGAAGDDRGRVAFRDTYGGFRVSAVHFGGT
jgi:aromatic ring-opening dioxygenase catalytic subunit (LigB family)